MKEEDKLNIDIDVYSLSKSLVGTDDACFYFRTNKDKMSIGYSGTSESLINSFISVMNQYGDMYDVLSASVILFEEDSISVEESEDIKLINVFENYDVYTNAIFTMFMEKHDVDAEWGSYGSSVLCGDDALVFSDVLYDVREELPLNVIWEYYEEKPLQSFEEYAREYENNSLYCDGCGCLAHNDEQDWLNDTPLCNHCGAKLNL